MGISCSANNGMRFYYACEYDDIDKVEDLIDANNSVLDWRNKKRANTPLMIATENEHERVVRTLIDAGTNVNARGRRGGLTALMIACQKNCHSIIDMLVRAGADVNAQDGYTTSALSIIFNHVQSPQYKEKDILKPATTLLQAQADPNILLLNKKTMLMSATSLALVGALLDAKADPNLGANGLAPLHTVPKQDTQEICNALVEARADVDAKHCKTAPLIRAVNTGHTALAIALLQAGADPNYIPADCAAANRPDHDVFLSVLTNDRNRNRDRWGDKRFDFAKELLASMADPTRDIFADVRDSSALDYLRQATSDQSHSGDRGAIARHIQRVFKEDQIRELIDAIELVLSTDGVEICMELE